MSDDVIELAEKVAARAQRIPLFVTSIVRHLLADQADAIAAPEHDLDRRDRIERKGNDGAWHQTTDDPEPPTDVGHSDPTPNLIYRIGFFRKRRLDLLLGLGALDKALDKFERVCAAILQVKPGVAQADDEPRCPGWTPELRANLGGCGNVLEQYTRSDRTKGQRSLCAGCRKAEGIARRAAEQEAEAS